MESQIQMKAMVREKYGGPEVLEMREVKIPSPKEKEVLIRVKAASINAWDYDMLVGTFQGRIGGLFRPRYKILGCDLAGTVVEVGNQVENIHVGDEVFGDVSGLDKRDWGGFAEYSVAMENRMAIKPPDLSFEQAAAIPQAGVLALQGLRDKNSIEIGQKILIIGAGGGVGTFAVQIAKSMGADVTGVDSGTKLDLIKEIGADHVIDYTKENFSRNGELYDMILDSAGRYSVFDYRRALNENGIYVLIGGPTGRLLNIFILGFLISKFGTKTIGLLAHRPNQVDLAILAEMVETKIIKPIIDKTYPLSKLPDAYRQYEEGNFTGKIVITIDE